MIKLLTVTKDEIDVRKKLLKLMTLVFKEW